MTPEQALRAAAILSTHAPSHTTDYLAALAAIDHLRHFAAAQATCTWVWSEGVLHASDPALGRDALLYRVSGFAQWCASAWAQPGQTIALVCGSNRKALKAQRSALAKRLADRGFTTLAQAVRDIRLSQQGKQVLATYAPEGNSIKLSLAPA